MDWSKTLVRSPDKDVDYAVRQMEKEGFEGECSVVKGFMRNASMKFDPSCVIHDALYQTGGSEKDRRKADLGFFKRAVAGCVDMEDRRVLLYALSALLWLIGIRLFGWAFFSYRKTPRTMRQVLTFNRIHHNKGFMHLPIMRILRWRTFLRHL